MHYLHKVHKISMCFIDKFSTGWVGLIFRWEQEFFSLPLCLEQFRAHQDSYLMGMPAHPEKCQDSAMEYVIAALFHIPPKLL
jgi:hypothetical protein